MSVRTGEHANEGKKEGTFFSYKLQGKVLKLEGVTVTVYNVNSCSCTRRVHVDEFCFALD